MLRKQGLKIAAISLQNEPDVARAYPTGKFSPKGLDLAARAFLRRAGHEKLPTRLLHPEVSQLGRLGKYLEEVGEETLKSCGAISVHGYSLTVDYYNLPEYKKMWREARKLVARYRKPLWMTEFSNYSGAFSGREQGTWKEGLAWARHVHLALVEGECSAVLFWGLYFDKKGEALIYAKENKAEKYEITPKFYTSKNWFRFVRPGAYRVDCLPAEGKLEASAFWHPRRRELVAVVVNPGRLERYARVRVDGLPAPKSTQLHRTSEREKCVKLDPEREKVDAHRLRFPPESVSTLVFSYGKEND
jgi:O-glycosyl hydrolase